MLAEILAGLTHDELASEIELLKARLRASELAGEAKDMIRDALRSELRDYARTVARLREINEHLERENKAMREAAGF